MLTLSSTDCTADAAWNAKLSRWMMAMAVMMLMIWKASNIAIVIRRRALLDDCIIEDELPRGENKQPWGRGSECFSLSIHDICRRRRGSFGLSLSVSHLLPTAKLKGLQWSVIWGGGKKDTPKWVLPITHNGDHTVDHGQSPEFGAPDVVWIWCIKWHQVELSTIALRGHQNGCWRQCADGYQGNEGC